VYGPAGADTGGRDGGGGTGDGGGGVSRGTCGLHGQVSLRSQGDNRCESGFDNSNCCKWGNPRYAPNGQTGVESRSRGSWSAVDRTCESEIA
jgi:hypothetical protein